MRQRWVVSRRQRHIVREAYVLGLERADGRSPTASPPGSMAVQVRKCQQVRKGCPKRGQEAVQRRCVSPLPLAWRHVEGPKSRLIRGLVAPGTSRSRQAILPRSCAIAHNAYAAASPPGDPFHFMWRQLGRGKRRGGHFLAEAIPHRCTEHGCLWEACGISA